MMMLMLMMMMMMTMMMLMMTSHSPRPSAVGRSTPCKNSCGPAPWALAKARIFGDVHKKDLR
eukprot:4703623-Karenia_brevis.AAC.1